MLVGTWDNNSTLPAVVLLGLSVGIGLLASEGASLHDEIYQQNIQSITHCY